MASLFLFLMIWGSASWQQYPLAALFFTALALTLLTKRETRVDRCARAVCTDRRLFGRLSIWQSRHPFSDFTAVEVWRRSDSEAFYDDVRVYLLSVAGKHLETHCFSIESGKPCIPAIRAAEELAAVTGIELHNYDSVAEPSDAGNSRHASQLTDL